ncbi:MAG: HTH-type transcriptional repressor FabR [Leptospiraceae bacterium]|nr:HTH-type transcriptional repressor FabR [Leptospiraceae bacterium]
MKLNQRYAQKLRTRTTLLSSALKLMGEEKSLAALSLREVAGEAGIVPAAFYRHFKDMEELGLALVDDVSSKLRAILKDARKKGAYKSALKQSIEIFFDYVKTNRLLFRFISRERVGSSRRIRMAIKNEMQNFAKDLATDMERPEMLPSDLEFISEFIINTSFQQANEFLDFNIEDIESEKILKSKTLKQLRIIYKGFIFKKNKN